MTPREQLDDLTLRARTEPAPFGGGQGRSGADIEATGAWLGVLAILCAAAGVAWAVAYMLRP